LPLAVLDTVSKVRVGVETHLVWADRHFWELCWRVYQFCLLTDL